MSIIGFVQLIKWRNKRFMLISIFTFILGTIFILKSGRYFTENMVTNEAIAHFRLKGNTPFITEYLYLFLKNFKYQELGSTSSIVTSINSKMIKEFEIVVPDSVTMSRFKQHTKTLFKKIRQNEFQICTIEKLRDTLLPKLMSGEVKVNV